MLFAFAFAFCFCFCSTPFFHDFKGIKTKEKIKTKKNQSPDPAILGWVRTRDPDPDHFGPDFDSGSGYGSALRICSPVLASRARMAGLVLHFLNGLFDMNFYLEKGVPLTGLKMWGTVDVKNLFNQRNRRLRPFFHTILKF